MARALVTGVNGFVGSHLAGHLLDGGWEVRGLVRRTSDTRWLPTDRIELVYGDAAVPGSLPAAVEGVDVVYHLAGVTRARDEASYLRVNAEGTGNLVRAARNASVGRFLFVSSLAAGGPSVKGRPRTEADADRPAGAYGRSKKAGEAELERNAGGLAWTVLRPCAVYGPRDADFLILARLAAKGWVLRFTGPPQPVCVVHVRDLVRAIVEASRPESARGRVYYVAHPEATTWRDIGTRMAAARGRRPRSLIVPRGLIPVAGRLSGVVTAALRRHNPLPSDRIRDLLAEAWTCDPARAGRDFGFSASVGLEQGIPEIMRWYAEEGWIR
jgi:nucleoside-diphosphate-sugar epimerase